MPKSYHIGLVAVLAIAALAWAATAAAAPEEVSSAENSVSPDEAAAAAKSAISKALTEAGDFEACDRYDVALKILQNAYDSAGRDADLLEEIACVELKLNMPSSALRRLEEARSLYPSDARFILWSAVAKSAAKDDAKAAKLLAEGLAAAGSDEITLYDLAERFLRRGALSVAAPLYERIISVYPKDSMFDLFSYLHLATYYGLTERPDDASKMLSDHRMAFEYADVDVMTTQEVDYLAAYFKGLAEIKKGDLDKGLSTLRDAAVLFPKGLVAEGEIVKALDAAGRKEEADGVYQIVSQHLNDEIGTKPEKAEAWHNLAFFVAASERKNDEGPQAVEWALRLAPLRPEYLATRAALSEIHGRYAEALVDLQRAMVLVSVPRWMDPGQYDEMVWRRLDLLGKTGKPFPAAFRRLPQPIAKKR